jgi:diguanylate cyclase (GGDEF)-like protein
MTGSANQTRLQRVHHHTAQMLGLRLQNLVGTPERVGQVRITGVLGISVGTAFSIFNMLTPGMLALGAAELGAVVFLLVPAMLLVKQGARVEVAETLVLAAGLVIFGALITFGGIEGTGIFWTYAAPFVAFFLKGQKQGWWYSLGFAALVGLYFALGGPRWSVSYAYSPVVTLHYLLSLGFYTLLAANFNLLRCQFEEKLQLRVHEKTAHAKGLLSQMQFLATHDAITGLPNRAQLLDLMQFELTNAQSSGHGLVVCNLRIERLFEMTNVLGLAGADNLVRDVAKHLAAIAQGHGLLARMRRDEFAIVYRLDTPSVGAESLGRFIAERQFSVEEQGFSLYIELTLGLSLYPQHSTDAAELLKKAELAMLQARKSMQQWSVYDAQQEQIFLRHHLLFGKLRDAMLLKRLCMHFQPQIDLHTGRVIGAEALVRWPDPTEGMIAPLAFIPVAEESGLIRPLTTWVIGECMRECARWHAAGLLLDVSINISALNLMDPELCGVLQAALQESGLNPQYINLEITESCFMSSPKRAMEVIQRIHDAGFRLSIDDFGTGFSSLSYLKHLPIDELKIDQSFVRKLLMNPGDQAIVSSTIALAHNLGLKVVAEGIEDADTAQWLLDRGCDIGQGYTYARPMPVADFITFVQTRGAVERPPKSGLSLTGPMVAAIATVGHPVSG